SSGDGGCIVAGFTAMSADHNGIVLRFDATGGLVWQKAFSDSLLYSVHRLPDGKLVASGYTSFLANLLALTLDANGNMQCPFLSDFTAAATGYTVAQAATSATPTNSSASVLDTSVAGVDRNGTDGWFCGQPTA